MKLNQYTKAAIFATLMALIASIEVGNAVDTTVSWTHPTQRTDGTALALSEIKETQIEYGACSGTVEPYGILSPSSIAFPVGTTATQSGTITGLTYGKWCFRARTVPVVNPGTDFSAWTGTVWAQWLAPPKPPVLVTVQRVAYEVKSHPIEGTVLGRNIGTVPLGTPCGSEPVVQSFSGTFYEVPLDAVTLSKPPKSAVVVAQCALSG